MFVRSRDGPFLLSTPGDKTFQFCVSGYGGLLAGAVAAADRPFLFLDIGANLGLFSLLAAANPHCERVIAIEPLPTVFRNLEVNVRRNAAGKVTAVRAAVDRSAEAVVHLTFDPGHSGMSRVVGSGMGPVTAPAIAAPALDRLLPETPPRIIAKIDVEGSEIEVIAVLGECRFWAAIDEILIEVSERNLGRDGRDRLLRMLKEEGFVELARSGTAEHYDARYIRAGQGHGTIA